VNISMLKVMPVLVEQGFQMTSKGVSSLGPTAAPATLSTSGYKRASTTKPSPSPKLAPPKKAAKKRKRKYDRECVGGQPPRRT